MAQGLLSPPPVFVNKDFFWNIAKLIYLCFVYGYFYAQ